MDRLDEDEAAAAAAASSGPATAARAAAAADAAAAMDSTMGGAGSSPREAAISQLDSQPGIQPGSQSGSEGGAPDSNQPLDGPEVSRIAAGVQSLDLSSDHDLDSAKSGSANSLEHADILQHADGPLGSESMSEGETASDDRSQDDGGWETAASSRNAQRRKKKKVPDDSLCTKWPSSGSELFAFTPRQQHVLLLLKV